MRMSKTVLLALTGTILVGCDDPAVSAGRNGRECERQQVEADHDTCRSGGSHARGSTFIAPLIGRTGSSSSPPAVAPARSTVFGGFGATASAHAGVAS